LFKSFNSKEVLKTRGSFVKHLTKRFVKHLRLRLEFFITELDSMIPHHCLPALCRNHHYFIKVHWLFEPIACIVPSTLIVFFQEISDDCLIRHFLRLSFFCWWIVWFLNGVKPFLLGLMCALRSKYLFVCLTKLDMNTSNPWGIKVNCNPIGCRHTQHIIDMNALSKELFDNVIVGASLK